MSRKLVYGTILMTGLLVAGGHVPADAQSRRGHAPRIRVHAPVHVRVVPQVRVHVGGWYRHGAYYPWGWGWGGWPGYYPPYPYYYGYATASVRTQVEPKSAEVYVDGHLAGMVDDFDGIFQRLQVQPGGHEITIYKEGFRTYSERLYLRTGHNYNLRHILEPLQPGEPNEPRPVAIAAPRPGPPPDDVYAEPRTEIEREPIRVVEPPEHPELPAALPSNFGQVAIRVQPQDAEVLIDDEPWRGPQGLERLVVHLRPGTHRVEIRKEGFDPFVTSIEVKKGETVVLNVSLGRVSGV
ncbi:MAG: PEGA domain-containing protein [Vicinamibacterales bacterium]|nr:PEGA domain-containing protein [Vicinamibacterales bacterium]